MNDLLKHLNLDAIKSLREIMGAEYRALLDTFYRDSTNRMQIMTDALAAADMVLAYQTAHSFKGSAGNMGAMALAELCCELEHAAKAGQLDDSQNLLEAVASEFHLVKEALENL